MIRSIRDRQTFDRLTTHGIRLRRSVLWCRWCPDPDQTTTKVAYAIGRACGPAVTRNRVRRRLRAIVREADQTESLPPGALLIGVKPAIVELTFEQLRTETRILMSKVRAEAFKA